MKLSKLTLAGAIAGLLSAGAAYAQVATDERPAAQPAAYNNYYLQDSDEEAGSKERGVEGYDAANPQAQPQAQAEAPAPDAAASAGNGAGTLLNPCCCLGEQWKLVDLFPCQKEKGINIAGWLAQSYTWNTSNPSDRFNGPVTWTDRSNDYQLNQFYLFAEKTTDTKGCGTDIGFRADAMFGTDYRFNTESGLETRGQFYSPKVSTQRFYGVAFTQFYTEIAVNDLKVKVGHWYAPVGYEVVPTTGNFFPSLPYTFQYGEPFTFTGVLGTYQYNENVSFGGGITHGWDNFDNSNPHAGFVGTYTEKFRDGASFAVANTVGNEPNAQFLTNGGTSFRYLQTNVYSRPLKRISDRLTYVAQSDFGTQDDATTAGKNAKWYGLNQYFFYKASDCMTYGVRYEWFRDQDGYRVGGFLGDTNGNTGSLRGLPLTRSGYAGNFFEVTFGANYKYSANTTFRPYARFDWFSGTSLGGAGTLPYDNGTGNSQTLLGFDVVTIY
ncbi:MAG TPA: outer membrane beta-barrel protein [Pirellulales bacterium]|nr:outer membrane beta-barrel protein [Pirellulales bacterium]